MGGTLPLLTAHAVKNNGNVGKSVALLYFINTLGSALAALIAALILLRMLGLQGTIWVAAGLNLLAAGVSAFFMAGKRGTW
jgi:predicted membrane-bound spermidine synthase